jgi:hypothetical protein
VGAAFVLAALALAALLSHAFVAAVLLGGLVASVIAWLLGEWGVAARTVADAFEGADASATPLPRPPRRRRLSE